MGRVPLKCCRVESQFEQDDVNCNGGVGVEYHLFICSSWSTIRGRNRDPLEGFWNFAGGWQA